MERGFVKPAGTIGRFGIVKLWPKIKAAEDENIARLKLTAKSLGLECVEVNPEGKLLDAPNARQTSKDLDFVIHLHFETPKAYDVFSFVALWNPVQFYLDWGYRKFTPNLLTHDDFLSCSSTWTDDHARRLVASDATRVGPEFTMYHSLSEPIIEPKSVERSIFYAGINWERLGKKKGRHQEILDKLDQAGKLKIYGPREFQGVNVWEGYASYVGPIPFDGVSAVNEIAKCGIGLVLSSEAHKQSELMSNRLFESLAAGAVIICDENPFAKRHFGDLLLYIDSTQSVDAVYEQILKHVNWINANKDQATALAKKAQARFLEKFALDISVIRIYNELRDRQKALTALYAPADANMPVEVFYLLPQFDTAGLERQIANVANQKHAGINATLLVDTADYLSSAKLIEQKIASAKVKLNVRSVDFVHRDSAGKKLRTRRMGEVINEVITDLPENSVFCFVAPDEEIFGEHIQSLAGALSRDPSAQVAGANIVYRHTHDGTTYHDLHCNVSLSDTASNRPLGFGRFLFRRNAFKAHVSSALTYLDRMAIALLVASCEKRAETRRGSIIADIQSDFNLKYLTCSNLEPEVLRDYCPGLNYVPASVERFVREEMMTIEPKALSLKNLPEQHKVQFAVDMFHSFPLPGFVKKPMLWVYRKWLHRGK